MASGAHVGDGRMRFQLLGPVEAHVDEQAVPVGGPRQRALLAVLLTERNQVIPRDRLVDLIWSEDQPLQAAAALQVAISRLRAGLEKASGRSDLIERRADGYLLNAGADEVDADQFATLARGGRAAVARGNYAQGVELLDQALALWKGDPLADLGQLPVAVRERARLDEERLVALEAWIEAQLGLARSEEVIAELEVLVSRHPARERFTALLMTALYRTDRQADALAAYQRLRNHLVDELGLEPGPAVQELHEAILQQRPVAVATPVPEPDPGQVTPARRSNPRSVPHALTRFVGRQKELEQVTRALGLARLVTLSGTGGCGKTRLAMEAARQLAAAYPDALWLVQLGPLVDASAVPRAVAATVGVLEQPQRPIADTIAGAIRDRQGLLVLDNCEHVLAAATALAEELLLACPGLRVLATSRQRLGLTGETALRVPSLDLPTGDSVEAVLGSDAGQLFVDRATVVMPDFAVDDANAATIAAICRELDGIPLAIELAAARLPILGLAELEARLQDRFRILSSGGTSGVPRQKTLRAAVDWSHDLLTAEQRELYRRASVFTGGFTLEAAEDVCHVDDALPREDVLEVLAELVDRSLVKPPETTGPARYQMLETLRRYGHDRLEEAGLARQAHLRHTHFYRGLAERALPELFGPDQMDWIERLEADHPNIRAALLWALEEGEALLAADIALFMWPHWWRHGHIPEGHQWVRRLLDAAGPELPDQVRAGVLVGGAHLAWKLGDFAGAEQWCRESLATAFRFGDELGVATAKRVLGMVSRERNDLVTARRLLTESLEGYRQLGDPWGTAAGMNLMVSLLRDLDDHEEAARLLADSTARFKEIGDTWGIAWSLWLGGRVATRRGDLADGAAQLRESTVLAGTLHHAFGVVLGIAGLAGIAAAEGRMERAATLLGAAAAYEEALGFPVRAIEREDTATDLETVTTALSAEGFHRAWRRGETMDADAAVAFALSDEE